MPDQDAAMRAAEDIVSRYIILGIEQGDHEATPHITGAIAEATIRARREERERMIRRLTERSAEYERKWRAQVRDGIESSEGTWYRGLRVAIEGELEALRRPPAGAPEGMEGEK